MGHKNSKYFKNNPKYYTDLSRLKNGIRLDDKNIILVNKALYNQIKLDENLINNLFEFTIHPNLFDKFGIHIYSENNYIKNLMEKKQNSREIIINSHNTLETRTDDNYGKLMASLINVHHNLQPTKLLSYIINNLPVLNLPINIFIQGGWHGRHVLTIINIANLKGDQYDINYNSYVFNLPD